MRLLVYTTLAVRKLHFLDLLLEAKSVLTIPLRRKSTCWSRWGVVSTPSHIMMPFSYGTLSLFRKFCMSFLPLQAFYHQSWPDLTSHLLCVILYCIKIIYVLNFIYFVLHLFMVLIVLLYLFSIYLFIYCSV